MVTFPMLTVASTNKVFLTRKCVVCSLVSSRSRTSAFLGKKQKNRSKVVYQYNNLPDPNDPNFEEGEFLPRKLTYMPPGLKFGLPKKRSRTIKEWLTLKPEIDDTEEWTETPCYPPLFDDSQADSEMKRKRLSWYETIKQLPTFESKFFEITNKVPHQSIMLKSWALNYDYLDMYQDLTRTHLIRGQLPQSYDTLNVDKYVELLKSPILNAVRYHLFDANRKFHKEKRGVYFSSEKEIIMHNNSINNLLQEINIICQKVLGDENKHLLNAQVDYTSDVRSWWWKNLPPPTLRNYFKLDPLPNVNQAMQFQGEAAVQLRSDQPLLPIVSFDDPLCQAAEVPVYPKNPKKSGWPMRRQYLQTTPGFWDLGDYKYDFPLMAYLSRTPIKLREFMVGRSYPDEADFIDAMAIMHGFGWLNGISGMHGFTPYEEITYPFTTHLVISDGQFWSFFVYQLNTHSFHSDVDKNDRRNLCWSSGEMKLFESFENDEFVGVNDDAIKYLVKLLLSSPQPCENTVLRPYLSQDTRKEEDVLMVRNYLRR
ncbi:28S ribosomal protein S30-like isoform X1, partial [Leptotrombidium deliense]